MFFEDSRYRTVPVEVTLDSAGRRLASADRRLPTQVTGIFRHTVDDGDRLDMLAYRYYQDSRKWWRILDANPEFMMPQAMLGKTPVITQRFPVSFAASGAPPWNRLLTGVANLVGVEDILLGSDGGNVLIRYNRINLDESSLIVAMEDAGFTVAPPETMVRAGKPIVIPPDFTG